MNRINTFRLQSKGLTFLLLTALVGCSQSGNTPSTGKGMVSGIINGRIANHKMADALSPVLLIGIHIGKSFASCTGTNLGNGFVLTAYHCVAQLIELSNGSAPGLILASATDYEHPTKEIPRTDYNIFNPTQEGSMPLGKDPQSGKAEVLREPDVSIIEFTSKEGTLFLKTLDTAKIAKDSVTLKTNDLLGAGYGLDSFDGPEVAGRLNIGKMQIGQLNEKYYLTEYDEGKEFAEAFHGDSGGPLLRQSSDGQLSVYGTLSIGSPIQADQADDVTEAFNAYVRLDRDSIQTWVAKVLSHKDTPWTFTPVAEPKTGLKWLLGFLGAI